MNRRKLTHTSRSRLCRYLGRVFLSLDQLANTLLGGDPDESISSRLGKFKLRRGGKLSPVNLPLWALDAILEAMDPGHCVDAIESDEGKPDPRQRDDAATRPQNRSDLTP